MKAQIESVEKKTSKSGKTYFAVKAGGKNYNCWEAHVAELSGKTVTFDEESQEVGDKTYHNMKNFKKVADEPDSRQASITMSYAKDIVIALIAAGAITGMADALSYTSEAYKSLTNMMAPKEHDESDEEIPF